ncbi:hypothetical protein MKK84_20855 [Methylobacterium sp. E-065]|uniref:hypothetical protein n=1 Tax=Methylobacterium sp. E-065 TaxID=2836583 RepID=UPI001FBAA268|nr:hypothetical protein [Methylobacterium sp. E-065]MCJ2019855.1 hypothetical protein [Methylobacterium sp. E-065]
MKDLVAHGAAFARAVSRFGPNPPVVLCQDEADGIAAGPILSRALECAGYGAVDVHVIRQSASAWAALASQNPAVSW